MKARLALAVLDGFLAVMAAWGALLVVPQLQASLLRHGPFTDFTVPALGLGLVAALALVGAIASFVRPLLAAGVSLLAGGAVVIFEIVEASVIGSLLDVPPGMPDQGYVALWMQPFFAFVGVAIVLIAFFGVYRPRQLRWGATSDEVQCELPGDDIVVGPTFNATRAVTVEAAPHEIWPWIAQIGFGRAGWYSYDLLDNFARHSSEEIIPSLQQTQSGDLVPIGPGAGIYVKDFQSPTWMLWWDKQGWMTWLWNLEEVGQGRTRLLTRVRVRYRWTSPSVLFDLLFIEPWDFPMMRKCMLGIKRRAESTASASATLRTIPTR